MGPLNDYSISNKNIRPTDSVRLNRSRNPLFVSVSIAEVEGAWLLISEDARTAGSSSI